MTLLVLFVALLVAMVFYMSLWFAAGLYAKRIDVVDSAWGLGFLYVAIVTAAIVMQVRTAQWLALVLVGVWGVRLAAHITNRNRHKPEDSRYAAYRQKWQTWFNVRAYFQLFLVQGLLLLVISTPVILLLHTMHPFQPLVATIGFLVWVFGIVFEATGDFQLQRFLTRPDKKSGEIMSSGLWNYSRHPNYFGEVTAWWGAAIVAISAGQWWGIIGAVVITVLITKVSGVPLVEKSQAKKPGFAEYAKATSKLFPLPPKR